MVKLKKQGQENKKGKRSRGTFDSDDEDDGACKVVKNKNPNPNWSLKPGEKVSHFKKNGSTPLACLDYWVGGQCKSDCKWRKSHVHHLNKKLTAEMNEFIKTVRSKNSEEISLKVEDA